MFKTGLIIGAHREELAFGEKTANRIKKKGIDVIRIADGIPNRRAHGELKSSKKTDLDNLYSRIHRKVCGKYDLVIDLHSGLSEKWSADIFSSGMDFLDFMDAGLKKIFRDKFHLPDEIRLFKIIRNNQSKPNAFDDRFPICLAFVPEDIVNGKHYRYVGLEVYLTSQEGCSADYRLSQQLILAVHECAMRLYLPESASRGTQSVPGRPVST